MKTRQLSKLINYLRKNGVVEYSTQEITLKLGPLPHKPEKPKAHPQVPKTFTEMPEGQAIRIPPISSEQTESLSQLTDEQLLFWSTN